jgi:hypothetical protein
MVYYSKIEQKRTIDNIFVTIQVAIVGALNVEETPGERRFRSK